MNPKLLFAQPGKEFFFRDAKIIAAYVRENCPVEAAGVIKAADEVVAQRFMFALRWDMERTHKPIIFESDIDWMHQPGDDPEWIYAFNRMRFWICLGQAYALTGDEKYADTFVRQMVHWVQNIKLSDPKCAQAWRSIEVGLRLEYWLKAMQYFQGSPAITPEAAEIFCSSVIEQSEFLMGIWNTFNLMSNWGVLGNHGLFMAGVMLPENERTKQYIAESVRRLTAEINLQVYRDGSHWEQSPMYHNEVLHCFLDVVLLADRCKITLPKALRAKTLSMCKYDLASGKPDHREPMMGDSDNVDQRDQISKGAVAYMDEYLRSRGYDKPDFDTIWDIGESGLEKYTSLQPVLPDDKDFCLADSGNVFMRSGWNKNDTWVHFQCGPLGAGHGHADKQHVSLFSRGENILTDAGRYSYVFGPNRVQFKELRAHNTIMADGHDLYVCKDSWEVSRLTRAVNLRFYSDNKYAYTEGGHLGYLGLSDGIFINRRVIFLKPDIIILADEFYSSGSHDYNQFFHFSNEGKLNQNSASSWTYSGENVSAQIQFINQNIESSAFDSRISYHYNSFEPSNAVETKFSIQGCGCAFTVIGLADAKDQINLEVNKLEVKSNFKDITFTDKQIEALEVKLGSQHYVVVVAHEEYASPTDTFLAGNCYGFGNAVVFDRSENEFETGTVLIW